jgi:hypothetical protein
MAHQPVPTGGKGILNIGYLRQYRILSHIHARLFCLLPPENRRSCVSVHAFLAAMYAPKRGVASQLYDGARLHSEKFARLPPNKVPIMVAK